jgi:transcriptional regulator with XRE-family HTH domain
MSLQGSNGSSNSQHMRGLPSLVDTPHHQMAADSAHAESGPGEPLSLEGFARHTPLSIFVRERLHELGLKQSDFCRLNMFDQGMLSRIQNSMVFNLNLESALRLAIGLRVSPLKILELIERPDLHQLILGAYANELPELATLSLHPNRHAPEPPHNL